MIDSPKRVLIVGGGISGIETALQLAALNSPSVIVEKNSLPGGLLRETTDFQDFLNQKLDLARNNPLIEILCSSFPSKIRGARGNFEIAIQGQHRATIQSFSDIVFCCGLEFAAPEWVTASNCTNAYSIVDIWRSGADKNTPVLDCSNPIVFVAGFLEYSNPFFIHAMMKAAMHLHEIGLQRIVVITDELRFENLTAMSDFVQCQKAGVLFIKTDALPQISSDGQNSLFQVHDPSLDTASGKAFLRMTPAAIIYEPAARPSNLSGLFWTPHRPDIDISGFYPPSNPHLYPVFSERAGIFYVGSMTGMKSIEACEIQASIVGNCILRTEPAAQTAEIDDLKCAICLTCVRTCPHHAVIVKDKAFIPESSCLGCGACIAECPAKAIRWRNAPESIASPAISSAATLFACERSGHPAIQKAAASGLIDASAYRIVSLPCSGNLQVMDLLEAVLQGSQMIHIFTCEDSNCRHMSGNRRARQRAQHAKRILADAGMNPEMIHLHSIASHDGNKAARILDSFRIQGS
jgi:coenzyme F420-reducing hydrogenase delta subunit/Pyruvate/2-oxoacid:ferredoxin oxidoreductase delta subunit